MPFPAEWQTLSGAERLAAVRTFGVRGTRVALRWRAFARRVRLAERRYVGQVGQRLLFARYLIESGRIKED